jgi:hypothetical protein
MLKQAGWKKIEHLLEIGRPDEEWQPQLQEPNG